MSEPINETTRKTRIYVASSWRNNELYPQVVNALKALDEKFEVYDFKNPGEGNHGFSWGDVSRSWGQIDEDWKKWTTEQYKSALESPIAQQGFDSDMEALKACDICVLVMPCGRSAHLEAGWATGAGRKTLVLWAEGQEAELMNKMHHGVYNSVNEVVSEAIRIHAARVKTGPDEELYARMSKPRSVTEAIEAYGRFFVEVGEARKRHQIRDLVLLSTLAVKEASNESITMLIGNYGDRSMMIEMLAKGLGMMRKSLDKHLNNLAGSKKG